MSNETNPPASSSSEQLAVNYVHEQLEKTRASLRTTQIVCLILIVIVVAYMGYVSTALRKEVEPKAAAKNALRIITIQVNEHATDVAEQIKKVVPSFVAQLPHYLTNQFPVFRANVESRVTADLVTYAKSTSQELTKHLDHFLEAHKEKIGQFLKDGQDLETVRQMGPDLEADILEYLKEKGPDGESVQDKFNHSLANLEKISTHLDRLAYASDLTPNEQKVRRAVAVLLKKADWESAKENP